MAQNSVLRRARGIKEMDKGNQNSIESCNNYIERKKERRKWQWQWAHDRYDQGKAEMQNEGRTLTSGEV